MILTLQQAIDILENELGCDSFAETGAVDGSGTFSTVGLSTALVGTGTGDLTEILAANDLLIIEQVAYVITSVSVGGLSISDEIELTDSPWQYVKEINATTFLAEQKRRNQSLNTSSRLIASNTCDEINDDVKLATALMACRFYGGYKSSVNDSNITSERIGDMSYSYDRSKSTEPLPNDIINILGSCYTGGVQPGFFSK